MSMNKILLYAVSIPKTLWVNFRWLPFRIAIKMPFAVSYDTSFSLRGKSYFPNQIKPFMIRMGFPERPACNRTTTKFECNGDLYFGGGVHLGNGSKIYVGKFGKLTLGDDFKISACSTILCYHKIVFGKNIQFSWDCLVMDSDTHPIFDENGNIINENKPFFFGDDIWVGCRCTILKGSILPGNNVIGSTSLVLGGKFEKNTIIAGNPAKGMKKIGGFSVKYNHSR